MENKLDLVPRIIVLQPGVPSYRVDFFARLAAHYGDRFVVYASTLDLGALTARSEAFAWERPLGSIRSLLGGVVDWQLGALSVPMRRGDVLVLWGAPRSLSSILGMLRAHAKGARVIWWGHYLSPGSKPWRRILRTFLMKGADALLFYTEDEISAYRATALGKADNRPIYALNNGIDTRAVETLRRPYRAEDRPLAALFIGRITEKANLGLALEALAQEGLEFLELHVIGSGAMQATLETRAAELGLIKRVHWHGGTVNETCIAEIANQCRFFIYPGDVGLSLLHGLSYGLPAILHSKRVEHMPEIAAFCAGKNGATFFKGSAHSLADVMLELAKDTSELDRLSTGAIATTHVDYNTARMSERFIDCLKKVMSL